jgi:phosphatidate cytidylyltransferase
MLKYRVITAIVGLPIAWAIFVFAPKWFIVPVFLACMSLTAFEIGLMLFPRFEELLGGRPPYKNTDEPSRRDLLRKYYRPLIVVIIGWVVFLTSAVGSYAGGRGILIVALLIGFMIGSFASRNVDVAAARGIGFIVSLCYGVLPWLAVWDLYLMGEGSRYVFLTLAIVWGGDTGAYFGGRFLGGKIFGKLRLAPTISPNKTWEGAIFGSISSVIGALLINMTYMGELGSWALIAFIGFVGGIFGMLGDLVESTMKRFARVKDSGHILPGHGGFLDRTDGILFAAPIIWFMLYSLGDVSFLF